MYQIDIETTYFQCCRNKSFSPQARKICVSHYFIILRKKHLFSGRNNTALSLLYISNIHFSLPQKRLCKKMLHTNDPNAEIGVTRVLRSQRRYVTRDVPFSSWLLALHYTEIGPRYVTKRPKATSFSLSARKEKISTHVITKTARHGTSIGEIYRECALPSHSVT